MANTIQNHKLLLCLLKRGYMKVNPENNQQKLLNKWVLSRWRKVDNDSAELKPRRRAGCFMGSQPKKN